MRLSIAWVTKKDRTEEKRQENNRLESGPRKLPRKRTRTIWLVLTCPVVSFSAHLLYIRY